VSKKQRMSSGELRLFLARESAFRGGHRGMCGKLLRMYVCGCDVRETPVRGAILYDTRCAKHGTPIFETLIAPRRKREKDQSNNSA